MIGEHFLWTEKYRPSTLSDIILPETIKSQFTKYIEQKNIPNLILSGGAGVGKTTIARAVINEIGADMMFFNASKERGIDIFRNDVTQFASTISFAGGRKYIILDEADNITPDAQKALRALMEEFAKNCGFILTCNFVHRLIEPIHSRCSIVNFNIDNKLKPKIASQFHKRLTEILKAEKVEVDPAALAGVITLYMPDWRRILNEVQRYSTSGKIDSGILNTLNDNEFNLLVSYLQKKEFSNMRKWVSDHDDIGSVDLFSKFYEFANKLLSPAASAQLIILTAKYMYQNSFSANKEINLAAFFAEVMITLDGEWKQ